MIYVVIQAFRDRLDNAHKYSVGDEYPRQGIVPTAARIEELSTAKNKRHAPVIKAVEESPESAQTTPRKRRKKD